MPDTDALIALRRQLEIAMAPTMAMRSQPWVDPLPMRKVLRDVQHQFDSIQDMPREDTLRTAVRSYLSTGEVHSFKELKYTCYGVSLAMGQSQERLVDRPQLLNLLLQQVDRERGEDRRFARCYQALLQSYFAFAPKSDESVTALQEQASFLVLRGFLSDRLEVVATPVKGRVPGWAITLKEHRNLLGEQPCKRYTSELAQGRTDHLADVCKALGISRESWIWQEVILAYLQDVCARDDRPFKQSMDQALDLSDGRTELRPSATTSRTVVARVVKRYSEATEKPELPRLRDASLNWIGNPWLSRPAWDGWVRHEPARQMVDGWLKTKLMEDFFTLLSAKSGGGVDRRRLDYWLRYVDVIEDMWFMLGSDASMEHSSAFKEMRARMKGRLKQMTGAQPQNNAFVMRIGGYQFVEFSSKGNALYIYPPDARVFTDHQATVGLANLKKGFDRLSHMSSWEWTFDQRIQKIFGRNILQDRTASIAPAKPSESTAPPKFSVPVFVPAQSAAHSAANTLTAVPKVAASPRLPTNPARSATSTDTQPLATKRAEQDLWTFIDLCRQAHIAYRIEDPLRPVIWLEKAAITVQHIAIELARLGFRYEEDPAIVGFWHRRIDSQSAATKPELTPQGSPETPVEKRVRGTDIESFISACREEGLVCWLDKYGKAWVQRTVLHIPHLSSELLRLGFDTSISDKDTGVQRNAGASTKSATSAPTRALATGKSVRGADMSRFLAACREELIDCWMKQDGSAWIDKKVIEIPYLSGELTRLGFITSTEQTKDGVWKRIPTNPTVENSQASSPLAPNKQIRAPDMASLLAACREAGIGCKRFDDGRVWLSKDAAKTSYIAVELARLGFTYEKSPAKVGFWSNNSPAPLTSMASASPPIAKSSNTKEQSTKSNLNASEVNEIISLCDLLSLNYDDRRDKGGNFWVFANPETHRTVVKSLEKRGFRYSENKGGYWLPSDD